MIILIGRAGILAKVLRGSALPKIWVVNGFL